MKTAIVFGIVALLLLAACAQEIQTREIKTVEKPVVKIGVSLPLTGDVAFLGESSKNGIELAKSQLDDTKFDYQLIFEDDKFDPKGASTAARKLIDVDNVDVIVSFASHQGNAISPIATESKVIHFGIASDQNVAKDKYNFLHWTPPDSEGQVWIDEAQKRSFKRIAIIGMQQQGVQALIDAVKKYLKPEMSIVAEERFAGGEKDFKTMLLKTEREKPDIYLLGAFTPETELIVKQMKELKIGTEISSIESFELSNQPELFEGKWYVNAADPTDKFRTDFETRFGKTPQGGAANMYDIFNMIVYGYENAGTAEKPSKEQVITTLEGIKDFPGALGLLNIGEEGTIWSKAVVRTIKNGKPVTIK